MAVRIEANVEPIPGYRLIERLGGGGFGEVWKCEAPGGLHKAIKFVFGNLELAGDSGHRAEQELKALSRVKTVRHPYILSLERFDIIDGQLIIIMELADRNLWDRYKECRGQGLSGIPRDELLGYMLETAEALDLMNSQYQLQHLDIKPQNLFLIYQHIKVADFGLVKDLEGSQASVTGGITPVYAAPETFEGKVTRFSDQYSLAIVFQELLTGQRPFAGASVRQLILQHLQAEPNLAPLPEHDRPIVSRALNKTPNARYPTCSEFVRGLAGIGLSPEAGPESARPPSSASDIILPSDSNTVRAPGPRAGPAAPDIGAPPPALSPKPPAPVQRRTPESNQSPTQFIGKPGTEAPRAEEPAPPATPHLPRPADTPTPAVPDLDRGGVLTPTLIIGAGGIGAQVLQSLRTLLAEEFGGPEALPNVRLLLIDTDPDVLKCGGLPAEIAEKLREAGGAPAYPLTPGEMLLAPLNRPSHYLRTLSGRVPVDSWLNQRMLYRIPREQQTTGIRALGRLALVDNIRTIQRRLQAELEACCDTAALDRAAKTTKLGVRSYRPRVIIAAGLLGGTGGGMFIDLAYLVRSLLRQMGQTAPQVAGLLFVPQLTRRASAHASAPTRPPAEGSSHAGLRPSSSGMAAATRVVPVGNACAALTELLHYSRPGTKFEARFFEREAGLRDADPPFSPTFLLPLPESPLKKESQEAIGMAARFLYGECASVFGRWRGMGGEADKLDEPLYRTFGLYRVTFPRRPVMRQVVTRALKKIVERWMSKDARPLVEDVRVWVTEQWRGQELGAEHFIERIKTACEKKLGKEPERAFAAILEPLIASLGGTEKGGLLSRVRSSAPVLAAPDPDAILEVLVRFEELLGRPQVVKEDGANRAADWNASPSGTTETAGQTADAPELTIKLAGQQEPPVGQLVLALRESAAAVANEWSQKLAELPVKLIELPAYRLAGAEEAVRQAVRTIEQALERHEPLGRELADRAADAYVRVLAFVNSLDSSRSWPRRGMTPEQLIELLRTLAKSRYQSLVLQQVLSVYVSLRGCLTDELREINFCRARLQELLGHLEGDGKADRPALSPGMEGRVRQLFPEGWSDLKDAVEHVASGLTAEDLLQLDTRLQKMIRSSPAFIALVNVCMASRNLTKELAQSLRSVASAFVEEKLGATDMGRLFLEGSGEAAAEELSEFYEEAVPEPAASARAGPAPWERVVVGVPPGMTADGLRELAQQTLADSDLVLAGSENDLIVYREWVGLRLEEVDPLGPVGKEAYQSLLAMENFTPHSRGDVAFEPPR